MHFWGYDSALEVSFFVEHAALSKLNPETSLDEAGLLCTFDKHRERILEIAGNIYSRRRRHAHIFSYALTKSDF